MSKKVILFIVEGLSDKEVLEPIIAELLDEKKLYFEVLYGDLTADSDFTKGQNMKVRVADKVKKFLNHNRGIAKGNIEKIIYITDTDGCYISEENIFFSKDDHKFRYEENGIYSNDVEAVVRRNEFKSRNMDIINSIHKIYNIPIEVYYFSCNLDYVLYNDRNLKSNLKEEYAISFADSYEDREVCFIDFMNNKYNTASNDYKESWLFIKQVLNSLSRCSNFYIFFVENYAYLSSEVQLYLDEKYLDKGI